MAPRRKRIERYTVTGANANPEKSYVDFGAALSYAITLACRRDAPLEATWYVRDLDNPVGHVETGVKSGVVFVQGNTRR